MRVFKADLHVHSKFSKRPSYWILQKLGASESYVDPEIIYNRAIEKGMDFVTITDHNAIDGCLEIAHLPGAFISEEVTTYFPDNGCKIHVLALNITEAQHAEIQKLRENIYDLREYFNSESVTHVVAHPMFSINDRLTRDHFEKLLVLFNNFEINGTRDGYQNDILTNILKNLDRNKLQQLADKHGIMPTGSTPWVKNLTGGSDDHSGNRIASMYTSVWTQGDVSDFLTGIENNLSSAEGAASSPRKMAHTFYSIAYQYYRDRFGIKEIKNNDPIFSFFDNLLKGPEKKAAEPPAISQSTSAGSIFEEKLNQTPSFSNVCIDTARDVLMNDSFYKKMVRGEIDDPDEKAKQCFRFVNKSADEVIVQIGNSMLQKLYMGNIFEVFTMLGAGSALYTMLSPYFLAYTLFIKDRRFCRNIDELLRQKSCKGRKVKLAHFTDTLLDVNGVAKTLLHQANIASKTDKDLTVITCGTETSGAGTVTMEPIGKFELPEYSALKLYFPSLLKMIDYCYEQDFNRIHVATPGPVGLAALATARILKLPTYGTYHTAFPEYVMQLTGDESLRELMWKYMIWFYNQMDIVFVSSHATARELTTRGIKKEKIRFHKRGIDIDGFHPSNRNGYFRKYQVDDGLRKLLYVGRVSKEKNVDQLVEIFKRIAAVHDNVQLVIAGDGPYTETMKKDLKGLPVTFTGFLDHDELKEAYASSDIFIFPSTTDTFGNVVLEAQSSGLPVIVTDQGGPHENLIPFKTGFVVPGNDIDAFVKKTTLLLQSPDLLSEMKKQARIYMENRSFENCFDDLWDIYKEPVRKHEPVNFAYAS